MKNIFFLCFLIILSFIFSGCSKKKTIDDYYADMDSRSSEASDSTNDINDPRNYYPFSSGSTFDIKNGHIFDRKIVKYDLDLIPNYDYINNRMGYKIEFFNYNKVITKTYHGDTFLSSNGDFTYIVTALPNEASITWQDQLRDSKYGNYGYAKIMVTMGQNYYTGLYDNRTWDKVFVTPLAYKYLSKAKTDKDGSLILVSFIKTPDDNSRAMDVLFYCSSETWLIAKNAPTAIF